MNLDQPLFTENAFNFCNKILTEKIECLQGLEPKNQKEFILHAWCNLSEPESSEYLLLNPQGKLRNKNYKRILNVAQLTHFITTKHGAR